MDRCRRLRLQRVSAPVLSRLIMNIGRSKANRRRLYGPVTQSMKLYAACVWMVELNAVRNRRKLEFVQRRVALRTCSAYRTVSESAALYTIACTPTIDIMARARGTRKENGVKL